MPFIAIPAALLCSEGWGVHPGHCQDQATARSHSCLSIGLWVVQWGQRGQGTAMGPQPAPGLASWCYCSAPKTNINQFFKTNKQNPAEWFKCFLIVFFLSVLLSMKGIRWDAAFRCSACPMSFSIHRQPLQNLLYSVLIQGNANMASLEQALFPKVYSFFQAPAAK